MFVLSAAWGLTLPIPSGPDEPTQFVRAASVDEGTVIGSQPKGFPPWTTLVTVPATIAQVYNPKVACAYFDSRVSGKCPQPLSTQRGAAATTTYMGKYPPLYYALVGIPSRIFHGPLELYMMRLMASLVGSAVLALAFAVALRTSNNGALVGALFLGITPTVQYLNSVLNPSGLEISSAVLVWLSGLALIRAQGSDHAEPVSPLASTAAPLALFAFAEIVLCLTRPASPAFAVAIPVILTSFWPRKALPLMRSRASRPTLIAVALGLVVASGYLLFAGTATESLRGVTGSFTHIMQLALQSVPLIDHQMIGEFGAPDFYAPASTTILWIALLGALLCGAWLAASSWQRLLIAVYATVGFLLLPFVVDTLVARSYGLFWQGRYQYPLVIGLILVAGSLLDGARKFELLRPMLAITVVAQIATVYWVTLRYVNGFGGSWLIWQTTSASWHPVVSALICLVIVLCADVLLVRRIWTLIGQRSIHVAPQVEMAQT